jgi:hypothetical protein
MADRIVQFGGKAHTFPGDATDDEIAEALQSSGTTLPSDEQIQDFVRPQAQAGGHPLAQIGQGIEDATARWAVNAHDLHAKAASMLPQSLQGIASPPPLPDGLTSDALKQQLTAQTPLQAVGQTAPSLALAAAVPGAGGLAGVGLNAATSAGITALDTGNPMAALEAGGGSAVLGGAGAALSKLSAPAKWGLVNTLAKAVKMGGLGALAGAFAGRNGGPQEMVMNAAIGALITRTSGDKAVESQLKRAVKSDSDASISRLLWRLLPPAVAHGLGAGEPSYDTTDKLMNADSPAALADIAKRRQQAQSVLR